jgi:acetone carboxylase gamma subunit
VEQDGRRFATCGCGFVLSPIEENWKEYATRATVSPAAAGPWVVLHQELEMREYGCPRCGRLLSVEVARKPDPPLWEIEVAE